MTPVADATRMEQAASIDCPLSTTRRRQNAANREGSLAVATAAGRDQSASGSRRMIAENFEIGLWAGRHPTAQRALPSTVRSTSPRRETARRTGFRHSVDALTLDLGDQLARQHLRGHRLVQPRARQP